MEKEIGILCHISSLPSEYGVGDFGKEAYNFVDFLANNGVKIWQVLPLNQTGETNCPYLSDCYFSYDEMFFDVDDLIERKLISKQDVANLLNLPKTRKVVYGVVKKEKHAIFEKAFSNISKATAADLNNYLLENKDVLNYAIYKSLLEKFKVDDWRKLDRHLLDKKSKEYKEFVESNKQLIQKYGFFQYILNEEWQKLRQYAKSKGVKILGDLPIYPSVKSFDVYDSRECFQLDDEYNMLCTGGVPKNSPKEIEQNWGSCVYDWNVLKETNYKMMINKIKKLLNHFDILRLDHFYGYVEHYEYSTTDRKYNKWVRAGGMDFFVELNKHVDINRLVVENLGFTKRECDKILKTFNLTGMCLLQSALQEKKYVPKNVEENNIYYIGTHDNDTLIGFFDKLEAKQKKQFCKLLNIKVDQMDEKTIIYVMKQVFNSEEKYIVFQIQDLLMQSGFYRMNIPGIAFKQWEYKMPKVYQNKAAKTLAEVRN